MEHGDLETTAAPSRELVMFEHTLAYPPALQMLRSKCRNWRANVSALDWYTHRCIMSPHTLGVMSVLFDSDEISGWLKANDMAEPSVIATASDAAGLRRLLNMQGLVVIWDADPSQVHRWMPHGRLISDFQVY